MSTGPGSQNTFCAFFKTISLLYLRYTSRNFWHIFFKIGLNIPFCNASDEFVKKKEESNCIYFRLVVSEGGRGVQGIYQVLFMFEW